MLSAETIKRHKADKFKRLAAHTADQIRRANKPEHRVTPPLTRTKP